MRVLILGGTQFVGRHIVEAAVKAGHHVTILTRGKSADDLPGEVERLRGDRNAADGLSALAGGTWDACVDVSGYTPHQVRASTEQLRNAVGRYAFISTGSVYAEPGRHPLAEDAPLLPAAADSVTEVTGETYGPLKVRCEEIVQEVYGERATVLRPQIVAGPFDHTARYPYWTERVARGGDVLLPGDGTDHVQVIDARDQGEFAVKVLEEDVSGVFNLAGPRLTWAHFFDVLREATGADARPVWVADADLAAHGLGWAELPLSIPKNGEQAGLMDMTHDSALAAGLRLSDPVRTARDTRAWSAAAGLKFALSPAREAEVLAALRG